METFVTKAFDYLKGQSLQVAVVFTAVLMLTWLLRNRSAHIRYLLWLVVAVKCLTPPMVIFSVPILPNDAPTMMEMPTTVEISRSLEQINTAPVAQTPVEPRIIQIEPEVQQPSAAGRLSLTPTEMVLCIWAAGAAGYLLWAGTKAIRLQRRLGKIRRPLPREMAEEIEELRRLWNRENGFAVWLLDKISQPFVWGLWWGAIYLPGRVQSIQSDRQKAVVMHEMAHVIRLDAFVNLIQILIQGVFWFHPLVWLANRFIRQEREKCCDETAIVRLNTQPKEYGSAIIETLVQEYHNAIPIPSLAVAGPVKNIEDRIKTIMQPGRRFFRRPSMIALLVIGVLAALVVPTTIALTQRNTPPNHTVGGMVADAVTGKPIAGAIVFDDGYNGNKARTTTGADGKFELKTWNEEHFISARAEGYESHKQLLKTFPFANNKNFNFQLRKILSDTSSAAGMTNSPFAAALPDGKKWAFGLTVIDKQTGKPLPGVQLELSADGPKSKAVTGQDGKYTVQFDKMPSYYFGIRAEKKDFVPIRVNWRKPPFPDDYTLALELGTSIGGIIRDEQGSPIEGVTVYLLVPDGNEEERPAIWDYEVKTDSKGRWRCDIMPARLDDVRIRLAHPDFINDDVYGTTPKPHMERLRDMTGVMIMKKGIPVAGKVLDADGKPVRKVSVIQGSDRWGAHYPSATTDDQGSFKFNNAKPGPMILTVQAAGFAPDLKEITVSKAMPPVEFRLQSGNTIKGRIVNALGNPVAGAFVAADTWRGHRSIEWRVNTDKEGRFQWNEAPSDEVLFDMGKRGFTCIRHYAMTPSKEDYLLTLHNALKISGKVVDAETGEPVKQFQVQSGIDWGTDRPVSWDPRDMKIFKNGIYEMIFDEPQQGYLIQINAGGYQSAVSRRFKTEEGDIAFDFKLTKQDWPGGIIKLPDGTPVAGAKVILGTSSQPLFIENGRNIQTSFSPFVETNAEGRFSFPPRTERYLLVVLHDRGCAEVSDKQLETSSLITLQPWGRMEGTLRIGSRPGNNENVAIWAESSSRTSGEPRAFYQWETTTDSNGHFALERLKAGSVKVGRRIKTSDRRASSSYGASVEVKSGETAEVSIGGTGRPIIGRVALPADYNQPVDWSDAEASIRTKNENTIKEDLLRLYQLLFSEQAVGKNFCSYAVIIGPDGSFRAEDVPEGEYEISISLYEPLPAKSGVSESIASLHKELKIAAMPGGRSDEPLDVGTLVLKVHNSPKSGQKTEAKIKTQRSVGIGMTDPNQVQIAVEARFMFMDAITIAQAGLKEDPAVGVFITAPVDSKAVMQLLEKKPLILSNTPAVNTFDDSKAKFIQELFRQSKNVKQLTAPKVTVKNKESADLNIMRPVTYLDTQNNQKSIEKGFLLEVLPEITEDGNSVRLAFRLLITNLVEPQDGKPLPSVPVVNVTEIQYASVIPDQQTLWLVGPEGIFEPSLSPDEKTVANRQRLLILIKPTIIKSEEQANSLQSSGMDGIFGGTVTQSN